MQDVKPREGRLEALDAIRGIASMMVVLYHFTTLYFQEFGFNKFPYQFSIGHFGVQFFFILSGFVIFMSVSKVQSAKEFIVKRFIRLYPSYWISLIITFLFVSFFGLTAGRETTTWQAFVGLSMFQGFIGYPNVDPSYWSLRPELVFYFLMALLIFFKAIKSILPLMVIIFCLLIVDYFYPFPLVISRAINIPFCAYFFSGILFYKLYNGDKAWWNYLLLFLFCVVNTFIEKHAHAFLVVPIIYLIFLLFVFSKINFISNKVLLFLGYISYPLYLIHQNIGLIFLNVFEKHLPNCNYAVALGVTLLLVILLATLITKYLEKPVTHFVKLCIAKIS